ncbi:hypothetical protein [Microcystis aeruginosa]|uniref:hypothetical protein n=1 Tax=Microcystis aeruginosa TaxID=1126 RepID=UPI000B132A7A|nr:hypothetical protein [Microcystis aeruginosa]
MATSKPVKSHTPHPTPHTLPPPKNFSSRPYLVDPFSIIAHEITAMQRARLAIAIGGEIGYILLR